MGDASKARKVLLGVQKALAKTGDAVTITRKTTTRDPVNPTKVTTTVETFTADGQLYPDTQYVAGSASLITRTLFIPDLLSVRDSLGVLLNTPDAVAFITRNGDQVQGADGRTYTLLQNEQPTIAGIQCAAIHEATE